METGVETIHTGDSMKGAEIKMMSLNNIKLGRNSRTLVTKEDLSGIMASIKEVGLLQPIGVSKTKNGYTICYGNRRFMACSRLGMKKIPVIIHEHKNQAEEDIKNLTENIQRRQISIVEAGRYISLLEKAGLNRLEIATRLGTSKSYVNATLQAFNEVPERYRDIIDVNISKTSGKNRVSAGKIGLLTATKIISARDKYKLTPEQEDYLFKNSKNNPAFKREQVYSYAQKLKAGQVDPIKEGVKTKHVTVNFLLSEKEYDRLFVKYMGDTGPFKGVNHVLKAILEGKITERIKIVQAY